MRPLRFIWYFFVALSRRWCGMDLPEVLPPIAPPPAPRKFGDHAVRVTDWRGDSNVALGPDALRCVGNQNVAVGYKALVAVTGENQ